MTYPTPPDHIHISEREADGSWEDCTWDSGLEWYRLCYDARKPATHAEAQLLRKASGEPATGGSNLTDLARGIKVRYGAVIPARISGITALKAALTPGKVAVVQGSMKAFGPYHRLSQFDRNFDSAHAVTLMNISGVLLWCDPEAPTTAAVPVTVSWDEVASFVTAFSGQHVVAPIKNLPSIEEAEVPLITYTPGYTANVKASSNVRLGPNVTATKVHATTAALPVQVIGTVKGSIDPANGSNIWYALWHENRVEYTAKDNIVDLKAPVAPVTDCSGAVSAAVTPLRATIDTQAAHIAELKNELVVFGALRTALRQFIA